MQRRNFLRRIGAAGASLSGLPLLAGRPAYAGGTAPTRRLVYVRGMHLPTGGGGHEAPMQTMLVGESSGPSFELQIAQAQGDATSDHSNSDETTAGQIQMMSHALACDVTRVGVLQFHRSASQIQFGQVDGGNDLDQHHALSHMLTEADARDQLQQILGWYDARLLDLVTALDSTIDVDGSAVLDNTVIVRGTEWMESNGHTFSSGHHLVLGGGNVLQSGQDVVAPNDEPLWKLWRTQADLMEVRLPSVAGYEGAGYGDSLA